MYGRADDCETVKRERDDLRYQVEEERRQRELQQERRDREAREHREESRRAYQEAMCTAQDWPEAFTKGLPRARSEAAQEARDNVFMAEEEGFKPYTFFAEWVTELETAATLYHQVMGEVQKEIDRLRGEALGRVADKLAETYGESETVTALREDRPEYLVDW